MRTISVAAAIMLALSQGALAQPPANSPASGSFVRIDGPAILSSQLVGLWVLNADDRALVRSLTSR